MAQAAQSLGTARRQPGLAGQALRRLRKVVRQLARPEAAAADRAKRGRRKPPHELWGYHAR
jgi:hypothetical protein